jgi:hypothetical protein
MSTDVVENNRVPLHDTAPRSTWWLRRAERRRAAAQDRVTAHLAELHRISELAGAARALVEIGWVQNNWFAFSDEGSPRRIDNAPDMNRMRGRPVSAACLVGAIVQAAGGPTTVKTQNVQRALALTWHTLRRNGDDTVCWCPAPAVREMNIRDLTRWNDAPGRTVSDVSALLKAVEQAARAETSRVRAKASISP